jgi:hypothetical protein
MSSRWRDRKGREIHHGAGGVPVIPRRQPPMEEDESVELFFGQLWTVPQPRSTRVSQPPPNLIWICKDLWDSRSFYASDCYLV